MMHSQGSDSRKLIGDPSFLALECIHCSQIQLQRMKQQYQGASRELQEAEEREGGSDHLVRRLKRTIADQHVVSQQQEDQVGCSVKFRKGGGLQLEVYDPRSAGF